MPNESRPATRARRPDRRRDRTREALLRAGRALFARRDVDGVSIDEIVDLADVAKGSFYNHFRDKEAFAREIGAEVRNRVEQAIIAVTADVDDAALHSALALCVFAQFATRFRDSARVLYKLNDGSTMAQAPINRNMAQVLERGVAGGRFRDIDLECAVLVVMGLTVITVRHVLEDRLATPPAEIARSMAQSMLRALGIPPAQARSLAATAVARIFANGAAVFPDAA